MNSKTKKAILLVIGAVVIGFVVGASLFSVLDLGTWVQTIESGFLVRFIGTSPGSFGVKTMLVSMLAVVFLVPSVRGTFTNSVSSGTDYSKANKKKKGGNKRI